LLSYLFHLSTRLYPASEHKSSFLSQASKQSLSKNKIKKKPLSLNARKPTLYLSRIPTLDPANRPSSLHLGLPREPRTATRKRHGPAPTWVEKSGSYRAVPARLPYTPLPAHLPYALPSEVLRPAQPTLHRSSATSQPTLTPLPPHPGIPTPDRPSTSTPASLPYTLLHPARRRADIRLIGNTHPKRPTLYLPQPKSSQRRPHHSGRTAAPSQPTLYLRPCNQPKSPPLAPRSPPPLVSRPGQPTLYPTTGKLRRQGRHTRAEAKAPRPQPAYPIPQPGQRKEKLLADRAGGDKSPQLPLSLSQHPKSPPCKAR